METNVEETGPVERKLTVEVPTADVDAAFDKVFARLQKQARIKGFRPGKVPRSVVERYFGDQARGEVYESLVGDTLGKAVEATELDIVSEPRLDRDEPPERGMPFKYAANLEVRPEIELKQYKGLEVERPELPEPEQDPVDAHIDQLRDQQASTLDEEEGTAAASGHLLSIDFQGKIDGEVFEGGEGEEMMVEIGSGRTIPGFEDNLVGLQVDQEKDFTVDFPEDYGAPDLAGKTAEFHVKVRSLKRKELPELDDEFAKDVSDFETLEAFRTDLREKVEEGRKQELEKQTRERAVDAVIEANPFPVPQSLVDRQLNSRLQRAVGQLRGLPEEQLRGLVQGWSEEWRPQAERDVQLAFLVGEIAKAEEITIGDEDVDAQLERIAEQEGQPLDMVKRVYSEQGLIDALRSGLMEERVVEFLVSEANLSDP